MTSITNLDRYNELFSLYVSLHYNWPDCYIVRYTVRRHGFASLYAGVETGLMETRPLVFAGGSLAPLAGRPVILKAHCASPINSLFSFAEATPGANNFTQTRAYVRRCFRLG